MKIAKSNEESLKGGLVVLSHHLDGFPENGVDYEYVRKQNKQFVFLPVRPVAVYFLVNNGVWEPVIEFTNLVLTPLVRVRARSISGKLISAEFFLLDQSAGLFTTHSNSYFQELYRSAITN